MIMQCNYALNICNVSICESNISYLHGWVFFPAVPVYLHILKCLTMVGKPGNWGWYECFPPIGTMVVQPSSHHSIQWTILCSYCLLHPTIMIQYRKWPIMIQYLLLYNHDSYWKWPCKLYKKGIVSNGSPSTPNNHSNLRKDTQQKTAVNIEASSLMISKSNALFLSNQRNTCWGSGCPLGMNTC